MIDIFDQVESSLSTNKVGIVEFSESDKFCNKKLYPRQRVLLKLIFLEEMTSKEEDILTYWIKGGRNGTEVALSPLIRERRDYLCSIGAPHFREIVFCGGRRSSKGFITGIAMAKVMWDALQLQDPGKYYGIDPEKEIYFSCVASAEIQAKKFQYADLVSTVETCKSFEPYLAKSLETEFGIMTPGDMRKLDAAKSRNRKVQRHVAKLRGNAIASNASTLRGSATMAIAIDEMAHMLPGESRASAEQVFDAAMPSLDQFGADAIAFCNSSPYTKVGKFYERYTMAMKVRDDNKPAAPMMFALQFPSWALYEGYQEDGKKHKKAITVSADWDPDQKDKSGKDLYSKSDKNQIIIAQEEEEQNPEKYKVERRARFAEVIDAYLNPARVDRMYFGRPHMENGELEFDEFKTNWGEGATYRYKYVGHLDPSSTTAGFGFALAHVETLPDQKGEMSEHVVFDIVKRWQPKHFPGGIIDWKIVINEVYQYVDIFRPTELTMDQYQSHAPIQELQLKMNEGSISGTRVYELFAPQPLDAKILTPIGWSTMGDLAIGSHIIGVDGQSHPITGVYPQGIQDVYKVTFSDESSTECTLDHLWHVVSPYDRKRKQHRTMTLREIVDSGLRRDSGSLKWSIPHVSPVQFAEQEPLPVHPYLLGVLLGDGCFYNSVWMSTGQEDVDEQEALLTSLLPEGVTMTKKYRDYGKGTRATLYFRHPKGTKISPLSQAIRELGLWGKIKETKFVPPAYLTASIADRIALLQGLVDSDGTISVNGGVYFSNISKSLMWGIKELVGSLGGSTRLYSYDYCTPSIAIKRLPEGIIPSRLKRKALRYRSQRSGCYRYMKSVEFIGRKETQCIRVDSKEHLYVTDDFVVTHNTNENNWHRAEIFKTALYLGLIHAPKDTEDAEWASQELKFLQQINTAGRFPRVDKQDVGPVQSKDEVDCMFTVVEKLIGNTIANRSREQLAQGPAGGAAGGYSIGGQEQAGPAEILGYYKRGRSGEQSNLPGRVNVGRSVQRGRLRPRTPRGW